MSFPPYPSYTKTTIKNAGKILVKSSPKSTQYKSALNIVNSWRVAHAYPINTFNSYLRTTIKKRNIRGAIVAQRLKRLPTIISKLVRYPSMSLVTMQDIGGIRAIVKSVPDVLKIKKHYLLSKSITHELVDVDDYIQNPKHSGYRGVHLIYRYNNTKSNNLTARSYKGILIEIQLRTYLQHMWATAVETIGIFQKSDFKSSRGSTHWLEFFALISSIFAGVEKSPSLPQYASLNLREVIQRLINLDKDHRFFDQLSGYSFALKVTKEAAGYYNVIVLDFNNKTVHVEPFKKSQLEKASNYLEAIENEYSSKQGIDAVLVSVGSLKYLRLAYPNYFLDMQEFIKKLKLVIKDSLNYNSNQ